MSKNINLLIGFVLRMVLCVFSQSGEILEIPSQLPRLDVALSVLFDGDTLPKVRGTYKHTTLNVNKRLTSVSEFAHTRDQNGIKAPTIKVTPVAEKAVVCLEVKETR